MIDASELHIAAVSPKEEDPSAILFANAAGIARVVFALRGLNQGTSRIELGQPPVDEPYPLRDLTLRVDVLDNTLFIRGSVSNLRRLAVELDEYLEFNDLEEPGMHTHVDQADWPGVPWIADDSTPLMVAGWISEPS